MNDARQKYKRSDRQLWTAWKELNKACTRDPEVNRFTFEVENGRPLSAFQISLWLTAAEEHFRKKNSSLERLKRTLGKQPKG